MSKVYVIYYDNAQRVLVGSGGTVGGVARQGFHLPGGTEGLPNTVLTRAVLRAGAVREVAEEFGAARGATLAARTLEPDYFDNVTYAAGVGFVADRVYVLCCWCSETTMDQMVGEITDGQQAVADSGFTLCSAVTWIEAWQHFANDWTKDWFLDAIEWFMGIYEDPADALEEMYDDEY